MQKTFLLIIAACFIIKNANSQITKGNWLVGGTASFSSQFEKASTFNAHGIQIRLSPDIGYFIADKFAIGLMPSFAYDKIKYSSSNAISHQLSIGPFLRYYFLKPEKIVNFFGESAY